MFKISSRALGLILITCYIFADHQINALKCYQCVQGPSYFCYESDMHSINCPKDAQKCGIAYSTINSFVYEWRGCVNGSTDTRVTGDLTAFGDELLGSNVNADSWESCGSDLCNSPLKCYSCTAGTSSLCELNEIGGVNCKLGENSCGKITFNDGQIWKGCLTPDQSSSYANRGDLLSSLISDFNLTSNNASSTGFYTCSTNLCNSGLTISLQPFTVLVTLFLSTIVLFLSF